MASSSVPGLDSIRDLFTSAERAVLEATAGRKLVAASRKQLEKTLAQARALRDKWRDLHAGQARKTKRAAGGAQANARSRTKADAFAAGIERIGIDQRVRQQLPAIGLLQGPLQVGGVGGRAEQMHRFHQAVGRVERHHHRPAALAATGGGAWSALAGLVWSG